MSNPISRRRLIQGSLASAAIASLEIQSQAKDPIPLIGNLKQSIAFWCFNVAGEKWNLDQLCQIAKEMSFTSIELVDHTEWKTLKKHGLVCAIAPNGMPKEPFKTGFNNPAFHQELIERTKTVIDACSEAGFPNVIAFTGYQYRDPNDPKSGTISRDEGLKNCVKGLKEIIGHAEKKKVNICIEHLNSRDDSHPMKGHPGYQGDDLDYVCEIIRKVGSERMKLLFDIYHVQIMHGDIIRRLEQCKDLIGHIHTAGNPGRCELDESQELNYRPIMKKLAEMKYQGYIGHEFIPTKNPKEGLLQALKLCDV